MVLKDVRIENFRGIQSLLLPLDPLTVLIGENNTGKSTILEAIRFVLTHGDGTPGGQFTEYDFYVNNPATPQSDPVRIVLHFAEKEEDEWLDAVLRQMGGVIQPDDKGLNHIWLQAQGTFEAASPALDAKWSFIDLRGNELPIENDSLFHALSRLVPVFLLSAICDFSQESGQSGPFWESFLQSMRLPEGQRIEIEEMLNRVNSSVIDANSGLARVIQNIVGDGRHGSIQADHPIVLEAAPASVLDRGKIQVHLKTGDGARLPLQRFGEGTQRLAVLLLYQAFTSAGLNKAYSPESTPILALEEPEAHLHPSAVRSLGNLLQSMAGQILVTSHSGDLVSKVPITALRRLYKHNGETKIGRVEAGQFSDREIQAINYNIRFTRGHYLFSRCWLFVEGESDSHIMPLLCDALGYSQDQISFSIVEISQVIEKGEPLIKFAQALGIQWFLMADGDEAGQDYVARASRHCGKGETPADRMQLLNHNDIEHEFWYNGYEAFIRDMVPPSRQHGILAEADGDEAKAIKWTIRSAIKQAGGKPAFAQELADEVVRRGTHTIPQTLKDIIHRIVELAGE